MEVPFEGRTRPKAPAFFVGPQNGVFKCPSSGLFIGPGGFPCIGVVSLGALEPFFQPGPALDPFESRTSDPATDLLAEHMASEAK